MKKGRILVVEDEAGIRSFLVDALSSEGFDVSEAGDGDRGLAEARARDFDLVLTDLRMPGMQGIDLVRSLRALPDPPEVVVLTAHGTVSTAVEAMRLGALDFLEKPLSGPDQLRLVARRAIERRNLLRDNERLRAGTRPKAPDVVSADPAMISLLQSLARVAAADATVLITGESGSGKEIIARELHRLRFGESAPFVALNCAAVPENLLESELFGHEKGAFTGAQDRRMGLVEAASDGTLFLDEIGEMPMTLQAKLLRVIESREFTRVGGTRTLTTSARFVAATHRDISAAVSKGRFREDLFYRLNVVPLRVPPLRERPDDIDALADYFLRIYRARIGRPDLVLPPRTRQAMRTYDWPGNVRELRNGLERACILAEGPELLPDDLGVPTRGTVAENPDAGALAEVERDTILRVLRETGGSRRLAANRLGISLRTLQYRIKEYGLVDR
jgi:two-component system response regulator FlrC